jgi:CRP-like cAMP-binding protein
MADYALSCCLGRKAAMPDIIKRINDLKGFDLFEGLSLRELQAIAAIAGLLSYQPGEVILREGEDNSAIILLIKGRIRICRNYGASNEELKATISPGSYIGELSLFTQRPANATCIAAEPTEALVIRHHHFQEIMKIYPQIAINLCRYFASKLRDEAY